MTKRKNHIDNSANNTGNDGINIERRDFIKLSAAGLATTTLPAMALDGNVNPDLNTVSLPKPLTPSTISTGIPHTTAGYCWPQTVRPGQSLDFMVSTYNDKPYQADLVQVICGNVVPASKTEKLIKVKAPFKNQYPGRNQGAYPGSFTEIEGNSLLNGLKSFSVQAFVLPTYLPAVGEDLPVYPMVVPDFDDTVVPTLMHQLDEQTLISRWDEVKQVGWAVFIDRNHKLAFKVANGKKSVHKTTLKQSLKKDRWYLIVATYDAKKRKIRISARDTACMQARDLSWRSETRETSLPARFKVSQRGALRFGAVSNGPGNGPYLAPAQAFNGKLDAVRMIKGVASDIDIEALGDKSLPKRLRPRIIGFWDFAKGIGTTKVHDISGNEMHGVNVNLPSRAVTGVHWNGEVDDWRLNPEHYSGCHYHDDDLYDVQWSKDFSYTVPDNLPSGVYAARLKHGKFTFFIPFFVAPAKGKPSSKAAYLVPTITYRAYTNYEVIAGMPRMVKQPDGSVETRRDMPKMPLLGSKDGLVYSATHPEACLGPYRKHRDGSACVYASQKGPNILTMIGDGYSKLNMDMYLVDWLHASGIEVDIITDDLLHREGTRILGQYKVVMSGHHPEYQTAEMEVALETYMEQGGRFMYLGGNGYMARTTNVEDIPGTIECRYGGTGSGPRWDRVQTRTEFGGDNRLFPTGVNTFCGRVFGIYSYANVIITSDSVPYERNPDSDNPRVAFIFKGINERLIGDFGLVGNGAGGLEIDAFDVNKGSPPHALVLATTTEFEATSGVFEGGAPIGGAAEEYAHLYPKPKGDIVFFETANGGAVFSIGSMSWISSLNHNNYKNNVSRMTMNVLKRFMDDSPFEAPKV